MTLIVALISDYRQFFAWAHRNISDITTLNRTQLQAVMKDGTKVRAIKNPHQLHGIKMETEYFNLGTSDPKLLQMVKDRMLKPYIPEELKDIMRYPYDADDYQADSAKTVTDTVANMGIGMKLLYLACGLGGEAGEVQEKIKKIVRDKSSVITTEDRIALEKELGDICWYIARLADEAGISFMGILRTNRNKLSDRMERGKLHGSGDDR